MQNLDPVQTTNQQALDIKSMIALSDLGVDYPVLPPGWKLEIIKGQILALNKQIACADFSFNAYLPYEYIHERDAGLSSQESHNPALAFVTRPANEVEKHIDEVVGYSPGLNADSHFIYAEISGYEGKLIRGWTGVTAAKVGDEVEMVVEWRGDHYETYALLLPAKRLISIYPECVRGFGAYEQYEFRTSLFQSMIAGILISLITTIIIFIKKGVDYTLEMNIWGLAGFLFISMFAVSLSLFVCFNPGIKKGMNRTTIPAAERIFRTLGWENVEKIDLAESTRKKIRQLKKQKKYKKEFLEAPVFEMFVSDNSMFYY